MSYHIDSHLELHRLSHHDRCENVENWYRVKEAKAVTYIKPGLLDQVLGKIRSFRTTMAESISEQKPGIELSPAQEQG